MNTNQMVLTEEQADLYDAALDHVNEVRNELDLVTLTELFPGYIGKAFQCPISNSIVRGVEGDYSSSSWQFTTVFDCTEDAVKALVESESIAPRRIDSIEMSDLAFDFQKAFDRGEFPELIAE